MESLTPDTKNALAHREEEAIDQLFNFKSKIEHNLLALDDEKEKLKRGLVEIRNEQENLRNRLADEYQSSIESQANLIKLQRQLEKQRAHRNFIFEQMTNFSQEIKNHIQLVDFEAEMIKLKNSFEGAINFYKEDSLQVELLKRTNQAREKRVEYTQVETQYNQLVQQIEEQKKEKERRRLAELEQARLEEEHQKRMAEQMLQKESQEMVPDELASHNSPITRVGLPFLKNGQSPMYAKPTNYTSTPTSGFASKSFDKSETERSVSSIHNSTMSQFFHW